MRGSKETFPGAILETRVVGPCSHIMGERKTPNMAPGELN